MQSSERQNQCSDLSKSSVELCFPEILLDSDLHLWLSRSSPCIMAPPSEHPSEDTGSSLGDSAYEILGDSTILTSSDEDRSDNTDSIASTDEHGHDDVASMAGTEESGDTTSSNAPDLPVSAPVAATLFSGSQGATSSGMTVTDDDAPPIQFEEPPCFGAEQVAVSHTIRNFDEVETAELLKTLHLLDSPTRITATVRQTMTKHGLSVDGPFRILYVGSSSVKDDIVAKIAAALAVPVLVPTGVPCTNRRSPRFNIVPVSSFGARKSPEVELIDSFGIELVVDDCTSAMMTGGRSEANAKLRLRLNDTFWCHSDPDAEPMVRTPNSSWELPHLAIFLLDEDDGSVSRQKRRHARQFAQRHEIPTILVSRLPLYEASSSLFALDHHSVHMCLESRNPERGHRIHKRLPIDLGTFLKVDARQMNRNLACLTGLYLTGKTHVVEKPMSQAVEDPERLLDSSFGLAHSIYMLRERNGQKWRALLTLGLFVLTAMIGTALTLTYGSTNTGYLVPRAQQDPQMVPSTGSVASLAPATTTATATPPSQEFGSPPKPSLSIDKATTNSLALSGSRMDLASLLSDPATTTLNESDKFKIQVVGDVHMILRPPHRIALLKKPPKLHVKILRGEQVLEAQLSKLFDGVYALQLEREEAYGPVNVTVWTQSRPRTQQTLEVDFGTPWLKVAGWKKAAQVVSEQIQKDIRQAQVNVQVGAGRLGTGLSEALKSTMQRAESAAAEALEVQNRWLNLALKKQSMATAATRRLSREASKRGSRLSSQLTSQAQRVTNRALYGMAEFYNAYASTETLEFYRSLGLRASKTFTAKRAQRQARRLWQMLVGTDGVETEAEGRARTKEAIRRKSCKTCRR